MKTDISSAQVVIDYDHHQIHEGKFFTWGDIAVSIASGVTPLYYGFITGDKPVHIRPARISSSADKLTYSAFEDATFSSGTALAINPYNRINTKSFKCSAVKSPTVTAEGNQFANTYIAGSTGIGGTRSGADASVQNEYVLKPNTKYLIKFANGSSGANLVTFSFSGYEE